MFEECGRLRTMTITDIVKPSDLRSEFFYEQCFVELFNGASTHGVTSPCSRVERDGYETRLDFDFVFTTEPLTIDSFRIIGPDGIPIKEGRLREYTDDELPTIGPDVGIMFHYWMRLHD